MIGRTRWLFPVAILVSLALAGCLGGAPATEDTTVERGAVETPQCTGNETTPRVGPSGALPSGAGGFELAASAATVERGEAVTFELTNVADERETTGTSHRYALQRRIDGVWRTVTLFPEGRSGFNATAVSHDPGTGFEWSFRASAAGFSDGKFVVCERLPVGEYRFVYDAPEPLAVEFELVEGTSGAVSAPPSIRPRRPSRGARR